MTLASFCLLSAMAVGQAAGPQGAAKPGEIKTLGDLWDRHEKVAVAEYLRSVVLITFRTPDSIGASRIETVLGPERVMVKMSDLDGLNMAMAGTTEEFWAVDHKGRTFFRAPLAGATVTTEFLQTSMFNELNKGAEDRFKNDESPFQLIMTMNKSGMPKMAFDKPLALRETKAAGAETEYVFGASEEKGEMVAVVTAEKSGRVTKALFTLLIDGYEVSFGAEQVVFSTEPLGVAAFKFPEEATKGYVAGSAGADGGSGG